MAQTKKLRFTLSFPLLMLLAAGACTTNEGDNYYQQGGAGNQGPQGAPGPAGSDGKDGRDGGPGGAGNDGRDGRDGRDGNGSTGTGGYGELPDEYPSNLPECEAVVSLEELEFDLFGEDGHSFYFEVTPEMRVAQDERVCDYGNGGPVYQLGSGEASCPPSAFNVRVTPANSTTCADTGKVELDLPGQSSWRPWSEIPNFKLDVGEFVDQKFSSGDKTIRLNNGQADSTIVREATALAIWRAMDYPAPPSRFVKTESNVWDYDYEPGAFAAHNMVKPYKKPFFSEELPDVTSAWEGQGNPFENWYDAECEWSKPSNCEDDVLRDIVKTVKEAPKGEGFMAATAHVIDWPMLHQNQCLSALTSTGDDWIHNNNNVVIALRTDGKIMYLPYSTDISGGHPWYSDTPYDAYNRGYYYYYYDEVGGQGGEGGNQPEGGNLANLCAEDPECRSQALDTCDEMIDRFEALDVVGTIVEERCDTLADLGLARPADGPVCDQLADFYGGRAQELRDELADLRSADGGDGDGSGGGPVGPKPID